MPIFLSNCYCKSANMLLKIIQLTVAHLHRKLADLLRHVEQHYFVRH